MKEKKTQTWKLINPQKKIEKPFTILQFFSVLHSPAIFFQVWRFHTYNKKHTYNGSVSTWQKLSKQKLELRIFNAEWSFCTLCKYNFLTVWLNNTTFKKLFPG